MIRVSYSANFLPSLLPSSCGLGAVELPFGRPPLPLPLLVKMFYPHLTMGKVCACLLATVFPVSQLSERLCKVTGVTCDP